MYYLLFPLQIVTIILCSPFTKMHFLSSFIPSLQFIIARGFSYAFSFVSPDTENRNKNIVKNETKLVDLDEVHPLTLIN